MRLRFASDAEVADLFRAATIVVLTYREILNSGSALLALSFDRPVPAKGAMAELEDRAGAEWGAHRHRGADRADAGGGDRLGERVAPAAHTASGGLLVGLGRRPHETHLL